MPDVGKATVASPEKHDLALLIAEIHSLSEAGRYGEALALVSAELSRHQGDGELLFARASVLFDWGRIREAHAGFLQAEAAGLERTALYLNLAWSCHLLHLTEAERYARKAVAGDPANVAGHFGLATVLQRLKRYPEAIASYERTLDLSPDYAQGAAGIAHCKLEQREHAEAEAWMRRALFLAPDNPQFLINLGVAITNQGRYAEALVVLRRAAEIELSLGTAPQSMSDIGFALVTMGQYRAAIDHFRENLPRCPDPRAHGYYAFSLLATGQLREGWAQFEFRWMQEPHRSRRPDYPQPQWGGQALTGKTILLLDEQGAGDIIHFARFAVPLKAMGATVLLQVRPELLQLARGFDGVDQVFARPALPPPFDYHIHLMSLPHVLGIELATVPAHVPYLRADPAKLQQWSEKISGTGPKVGLVWAGNPKYPRDNFRSVAFDQLNGLWEVKGIQFFSLQTPLRVGELEKFPTAATLKNLEPELTDFAETAAAIAHLDLVICVDTAVAHLAGALGKPVWLLLPEVGDFRWLEGREDSPWYPTMRLFRQRVLGEWEEVVARVKDALQEAVRTESWTAGSEKRDSSGGAPKVIGAAPTVPTNIARVAETRYGIMQYLPDGDRATRSIAWYGEFLRAQLELLSRLIGPGSTVVEVGSGIGDHALALAKMVGARGHLLVYETRPVIRQILLQNLELNRVAGIVTLMRRELAGPRKDSFEDGQSASGASDSAPAANAPTAADTLDALQLDRLDLLKIRAEANAADVLVGAGETLWRLRPIVFISAPDSSTLQKLAERVRAFGYRCWRMEMPYFDPDNFSRRDVDIFDAERSLDLLAIPEEVDVAVSLDPCVEVTVGLDPPHAAAMLRGEAAQLASPDSGEAVDDGEQGLLRFLRKLLR